MWTGLITVSDAAMHTVLYPGVSQVNSVIDITFALFFKKNYLYTSTMKNSFLVLFCALLFFETSIFFFFLYLFCLHLESSNTQISSWNSESPHQTSNFNSRWTPQCRTLTLKSLLANPKVDKKFRTCKFYFHSSLSVLSDDAESSYGQLILRAQ